MWDGKGLLGTSIVAFLECYSVRIWWIFLFLGRYEITEIPLPSSVIEQINKNNVQVTPTGVSIQTVAIEQLPQAPQPGK